MFYHHVKPVDTRNARNVVLYLFPAKIAVFASAAFTVMNITCEL